ncbi:hypothetical protein [Tabrizicola sp.]|uniref:hypothetical protein n=1 Tax=Tabrizicola sp. TaxID=2005166 RepID=UPI003F3918B9
MRSTILAAIVALSATMAFAQEKDMMEEMSMGLTMLEASAKTVLQQYGLEADVMSLTLGQLAAIQGALTGSNNDAEKKAQIEAALRK